MGADHVQMLLQQHLEVKQMVSGGGWPARQARERRSSTCWVDGGGGGVITLLLRVQLGHTTATTINRAPLLLPLM